MTPKSLIDLGQKQASGFKDKDSIAGSCSARIDGEDEKIESEKEQLGITSDELDDHCHQLFHAEPEPPMKFNPNPESHLDRAIAQ